MMSDDWNLVQCLHFIHSYKTKHKKQSCFVIFIWTLHLSKVSVTSVTHGAIYDTTDGGRGDWMLGRRFMGQKYSFLRGLTQQQRVTGKKEGGGGREGGGVVHTTQHSLAQVDIRHPISFSLQHRSHAGVGMDGEVAWRVGGQNKSKGGHGGLLLDH